MPVELVNCPLCGKKPRYTEYSDGEKIFATVECSCGLRMNAKEKVSAEETCESWNVLVTEFFPGHIELGVKK